MANQDLLIELVKEKYQFEYSRKKYFEDTLNFPITLITALIAAIYIILQGIPEIKSIPLSNCCIALMCVLSCLIIISFIYLYKVYIDYGKAFASLPDSREIKQYYEQLIDFYEQKTDGNSAENTFDETLKNQIVEWYIEANKINHEINQSRANAYYKARRFLGLSILISILLLIIFAFTKLTDMSNKKQKTEPSPPKAVSSPKPLPQPPKIRVDKFSAGGDSVKKIKK